MATQNRLISNYLARAAEALVDFYESRGVALNSEQKKLAQDAFDHSSISMANDPDHHPSQLILL